MVFNNYSEVLEAQAEWEKQACMELGGEAEDTFYSASTQNYLVMMGMVVFFMQAGFSYLEAGSMGSTAVTSTLFKNYVDAIIGAISFFMVGYGFFNGRASNKFIGHSGFFLEGVGQCEHAFVFFMFTFSQVTCTIVSGAIAGRTKLIAYVVNTVVLSAFVWPVVAHWCWSNQAWLADGSHGTGYNDYAGSGVVHVVGGTAACSMSYLVGPRGTPLFEKHVGRRAIPGHSMPLVAHGTIILWFGFLAFNGGSIIHVDTMEQISVGSLAIINTTLAPCGGGLGALLVEWLLCRRRKEQKYWSLSCLCNGSIAGMVSICAGANQVRPWASILIGLIGGAVYRVYAEVVDWMLIDDPVQAIAVHFGGGTWGVVSVALFSQTHGLFYDISSTTVWSQLGWNLLGLFVVIMWTVVTAGGAHLLLWYFDLLRVDDEHINMGLDLVEHGEGAYHILSGNAALPMHARTHPRKQTLRNRGPSASGGAAASGPHGMGMGMGMGGAAAGAAGAAPPHSAPPSATASASRLAMDSPPAATAAVLTI